MTQKRQRPTGRGRQHLRLRRALGARLLCLRRAWLQPGVGLAAGLRLGWLLRALERTLAQLARLRGAAAGGSPPSIGLPAHWRRGQPRSLRAAATAGAVGLLACTGTLGEALVPGAHAQPARAGGVGSEFRVNSFTTGAQRAPAVAMDADGDFVVAWESSDQDGSSYSVYAQRYSAAGVAQGAEFRVNTYAASVERNPAVAMDADGDFVVAWQSYGQDGSGYGVYAQRYSAAGVAQGAEFRVNSYTTGSQSAPAVAMDADGDFVVTWTSSGQDGADYGIYAQRYSAAGVAQGAEFRVNSYTTGRQLLLAVAMDADGDFVVAWESNGQDGSGYGIYAQRYNAAGIAQGGEFQVNSFTTGNQRSPTVAMDADGDFVVTWASVGQDGSGYGVYAQRYSAGGVAQGGEFLVNTYTTSSQRFPTVAMDADGDFVVTWPSTAGQDGNSYGVYAQRYSAAGVAQGAEFRVNSFTVGRQRNPAVAMDADGDFVVAWESFDQDGSNYGVYAQRFQPTPEGVAGPASAEFRVNTFTTGAQRDAALAADASGGFVVSWTSSGQDGDAAGVYAQRYNAVGRGPGQRVPRSIPTRPSASALPPWRPMPTATS